MRNLALAALIGSTFGFTVACQSYDFERVDPLAVAQTKQSKKVVARNLKPNMMLLVDKSGSMNLPTDPGNSNCPAGCGGSQLCPTNCPTRISELKSAMSGFLTTYGQVARLGVAFFPNTMVDVCAGTPVNGAAENLPDPSTSDPADGMNSPLQMKALAVNAKIQAVTPGGGTPTGESLKNIGQLPGLRDTGDLRDDFIVLLTDGLPNCNAANMTNSCSAQNPACICTIGNASACSGQFCAKGCLDRSGVVDQVQNLRNAGIKVIVVGFGAETASGDAPATLNAIASAGGFARTCPMGTDAECGSRNTCVTSTKVCASQFYQASNATELGKALADISSLIHGTGICEFALDSQPTDPKLLAVSVDGVSLAPGADTWQFESGKVIFKGAQCTKLGAATPAAPVNVDIRIVETL